MIEWIEGRVVTACAAELRARHAYVELAELAASVVKAFSWCHEHGIVHGDVHAANILVERDSRVRIIDFGLAAQTDGIDPAPRRGGVAAFFEPEFAKRLLIGGSRGRLSTQGEQYGLAALLYMMFTGRTYVAFSAERNKILRQIIEDAPLPFSSFESNVFGQIESVVLRALEKSPDDRFPDVRAFHNALATATSQELEAGRLRQPAPRSTVNKRDSGCGFEVLKKRWSPTPEVLERVFKREPSSSFMFGAIGIAYAWYRVGLIRHDPIALANADIWLSHATRRLTSSTSYYSDRFGINPTSVGTVSPFHCESGLHFVQAMTSSAMGDFVSTNRAVLEYLRRVDSPCQSEELSLGRSGILLSTAILVGTLPANPLIERAKLLDLGAKTQALVWERLGNATILSSPLEFLGMAHGWAGVLFASIRWAEASATTIPPILIECLTELGTLAQRAGPSGLKWWRKLNAFRGEQDVMAGWCNGSAGMAILWAAAHRILGTDDFKTLCLGAAQHAYEFDNGGKDLCCGLAGRAYALLNAYQVSHDEVWLNRANELCLMIDEHVSRDWPDSLFKGSLGPTLLSIELSYPDQAALPLFEPLSYRL